MKCRLDSRYILLFVAVVSLSSCSDPIAPVAPIWDVNLNVPLISQNYTMTRLLEDDSALKVQPSADNLLVLKKSFTIKSISIGDELSISDQEYSSKREIGALRYDIPSLAVKSYTLATVFPSLSDGHYAVVPVGSPEAITIPLDTRNFFTAISYDEGTVSFLFENGFAFPIEFPRDPEIVNSSGQVTLVLPNPGRIEGGTNKTASLSLAGKSFTSDLYLKLYVSTPGTMGVPVNVSRDQYVRTTAGISGSKIRSITGLLPSQTTTTSESSDIASASGLEIDEGLVQKGSIDIVVESHIPVSAMMEISIPGLTRNGETAGTRCPVGAYEKRSISIDLAGYNIKPTNRRYLEYRITMTSDAVTGSPVTMTSTDYAQFSARLNGLVMSRMHGVLSRKELEVDQTQSVNFDVTSRLKGTIEFSEARINARLSNGTIVPMNLIDGELTGYNARSGKRASITLPQARIEARGTSSIAFGQQDVVKFLNTFGTDFPDQLGFKGHLMVNPDLVTGDIYSTDSVACELDVEIPMHFKITGGSITDTSRLDFNDDNRSRMTSVGEGALVFDLENHLPAGISIEPVILDDNQKEIFSCKTVSGGNISVQSAGVDGAGNVTTATRIKTDMRLDKDDIEKIAKGRWIKIRVNLDTPSGGSVKFKSTDYIRVRAYATFKVSSDAVTK